MFVAVVGCTHGEIDKIFEVVGAIEEKRGIKVSLVLCCGDFQSVRNMTDLRCMACPIKYQQMHDFHRYYSGEKVAPIPLIFIGGNHEASNYLQELPYGGWVAPNIFFLGTNIIRVGSVRIGGISGIFKGHDYLQGKFECPPYTDRSIRSVYHYRNLDTFRLKQVKSKIDIFLSHDWPLNIHRYGDTLMLLRKKPFFRQEMENGTLGSQPLEQLLHHLQPSYWFSAHMHVAFSAVVGHDEKVTEVTESGPKVTKFLALDKSLPGRHFLQILEIPNAEEEMKFQYDPEWLAILRYTNSLLSVKSNTCYMPGPNSIGDRHDFCPTDEEIGEIVKLADGNLEIPLNFVQTAPPYEPGEKPTTAYPLENPQTTVFCDKWSLSDPVRLLPGYVNGLGSGQWENGSPDAFVEFRSDIDQEPNTNSGSLGKTTGFTRSTFNPDEISLEEDDDAEDSEAVGQSSRSKMNLPLPVHEGHAEDEQNAAFGTKEDEALKFLTSSFEVNSTEPLFVLDTVGAEPTGKRRRRNWNAEENSSEDESSESFPL